MTALHVFRPRKLAEMIRLAIGRAAGWVGGCLDEMVDDWGDMRRVVFLQGLLAGTGVPVKGARRREGA